MKIFCDGSYRPDMFGKPSFSAWSAWQYEQEMARWSARVEAHDSIQAELIAVMHALVWGQY